MFSHQKPPSSASFVFILSLGEFQIFQLYVQDANYIWSHMKDVNEKKVLMTHDGYLKLYQLSKPSLQEYDCILIDEAQDLTPGTSAHSTTSVCLITSLPTNL